MGGYKVLVIFRTRSIHALSNTRPRIISFTCDQAVRRCYLVDYDTFSANDFGGLIAGGYVIRRY